MIDMIEMIEIIKVKDDIIVEHSFVNRENSKLRDGEIEVKDFNGNVGDNVSLYDENWNIIPVVDTNVDTVETVVDTNVEEEVKVESEPAETAEPASVQYNNNNNNNNITTMLHELQEIDFMSVRAIRAILSGTATEEDHKILEALEKQAVDLRNDLRANLRNELNDTVVTEDDVATEATEDDVDTEVDTDVTDVTDVDTDVTNK